MFGKPTWYDNSIDLFCITCGSQLLETGRVCNSCRTPVQVSKSVALRKNTKLVSVLGASGAGKTVYLGMLLDMLSKGCNGMRGLPNGSFSLEVQDRTIRALENQRFPEKTPSEPDRWNWVHCEAFFERKPKRRIDLITPDIAGEALAHELEHASDNSTIHSLIVNSNGLILLLDARRIRDDARGEDISALKLTSHIADLHTRTFDERRQQVRLPLAFVLTKTDTCDEATKDPQLFAKTNMPGLFQFCESNFQSFQFSSASVVGSSINATDEMGNSFQVPLHIQPRGIVEPLDWILGRLEKKWRRNR